MSQRDCALLLKCAGDLRSIVACSPEELFDISPIGERAAMRMSSFFVQDVLLQDEGEEEVWRGKYEEERELQRGRWGNGSMFAYE